MLADDKLKEKLTQYTRPKNCEKLLGTKVNPEIWAKISLATRSRDLQKIQTTLLRSGSEVGIGLVPSFLHGNFFTWSLVSLAGFRWNRPSWNHSL